MGLINKDRYGYVFRLWGLIYTPYPTGEKHTISTFVYQIHIGLLANAEKPGFFKSSFPIY